MNAMKKNGVLLVAGLVLVAGGVAGGWWWGQRQAGGAKMEMSAQKSDAGMEKKEEAKPLYWYDPMYPQQKFDKPGKSPFMDMQLVPKYAESGGSGGLKIDPNVTQSLGIRLATVEQIPLAMRVEATGLIAFNERDIAIVQARNPGFVERVWPLAPGNVIRAGQPLVEFTVPEWAAGQHEFLAVRNMNDPGLLAAARDRLRLMGMPEYLIKEVEKTGQTRNRYVVSAPIGGALQNLEVRAGMTVMAGQTLARINGLGTVWLEAALPEAQAAAVRPGAQVEAKLSAFPGQMFKGQVKEILPALNDATRSLRLRIEFPNRDGRLRPGLTAQVMLASPMKEQALSVPTEALIRTGKRTLVMVAYEDGSYDPVEVMAGQEVGDRTVILSGLEEGDQIVASGQFLLDSEASLSGITARAVKKDEMKSTDHGEHGK